jgi:dTDP-4-amino-4,6-dideoxygalactose transaminase
MSLGIGDGDSVLTTPNTAFATACAISRCGATPVFVDIDPGTWLLDRGAAAAACGGDATAGGEPAGGPTGGGAGGGVKAIVPVHLYGHVVDVPALRRSLPPDITIVEDCAQAHGATLNGMHAGGFGDAAAFSFYPSKNLCALGDAGAVATRDAETAELLRRLRFYGQDRRDNHIEIGVNSRMDELQAALLVAELEHVDRWIERRREIAAAYDAELDGEIFRRPQIVPGSRPSFHLYVVRVDDRTAFRSVLDAAGIDTGVHYPTPIPYQPAYRGLGYEPGDFPHAESLAAEIVSLPVAPHLTDAEVERVIAACRAYARGGGS